MENAPARGIAILLMPAAFAASVRPATYGALGLSQSRSGASAWLSALRQSPVPNGAVPTSIEL